MTDNPDGKLKANSQAPKSMGGGANHPFEATPSLYLNEPEGIQANREQMGYSLGKLLVDEGSELVIDTDMPELVVTGNIRAYYDGKGNIVVETPSAEQEELRLLREYYQNDRAIITVASTITEQEAWKLTDRQEELALQIDILQSPAHSGAVGLPEAGGRLGMTAAEWEATIKELIHDYSHIAERDFYRKWGADGLLNVLKGLTGAGGATK